MSHNTIQNEDSDLDETARGQEGPQQESQVPSSDDFVAQEQAAWQDARIEAARIETARGEERKQERNERQEQDQERMQVFSKLTQEVQRVVQLSLPREQGTATLHSELKTLRAAVLLARSVSPHNASEHNVESQADDRRLQPLDAVRTPGDPFPLDASVLSTIASDPFSDSVPVPDESETDTKVPQGGAAAQAKRKRTLSPETRAKISAAQTLIWAKRHGQ